jgi:TonB family protein
MNNFFNYMIESVAVGVLFYGFYFLVLKKMTSFKLSRYYLLLSAALMFILPLIELPVNSNIVAVSYGTVVLEEIVAAGNEVEQSTFPDIFTILSYAYILVSLMLFVKFIYGFVSVFRIYRRSSTVFFGDRKLVLMNNQLSPFSFFGIVFISNQDVEDYDRLKQILFHEDTHIKQMHTLDNIFAGILSAVFWFNPFVWLIKYSLKSTHEYLADAKVLEQGFDPAGYFMLLFSDLVGIKTGLANNFNNSLTLKRMKMMKKEKSPRMFKLAYLMILPVAVLSVLAFSCTNAGAGTFPGEKKANVVLPQEDTIKTSNSEVFEVVDEMPVYGNGQEDLVNFIISEVKYPQAAKEKGIEGKVFVSYIVNKDGSVSDVKVVEAVNPLLDAEAVRVVSSMKKWTPGKNEGKPVAVSMVMPIMFKLK